MAKFFINRPIVAMVISILMVMVGIVAMLSLPIAQFPNIADPQIQVVLSTGGTGFSRHNCVPEAVGVLLDREVTGFGELFRQLSYNEIGAAAIQSRCLGGYANGTLIFCLPGSPGACGLAWTHILRPQLDHRTRPCNFAGRA